MPVLVVTVIGAIMVLVFVGLDVWWALDGIKDNTWSEIINNWAKNTPLIAWIYAVLAGHFFGLNYRLPLAQADAIGVLIWLTAVVVILGFAFRGQFPLWAPLLPGYFAGALLWTVR